MSDLHAGHANYGAGEFQAMFDQADVLAPAFTIVSGDITNTSDPLQFAEYTATVATLDNQAYTIPGNHDNFGNYSVYDAAGLDRHFVINYDGFTFIGFQTDDVGDGTHGTISAGELAWLETQLQAATGVIVAISHYPILDIFSANVQSGDGQEELLALLATYDVKLFLSGHTHHDCAAAVEAGTIHIDGASTAFTVLTGTDGGMMVLNLTSCSFSLDYIIARAPWTDVIGASVISGLLST